MSCINNCKLCNRLILSTAINYDETTNQTIVALPAGAYGNCEKYCIVLAQSLPTASTINSQVVFTIGTGATRYQFLNKDCTPVLASQIRTRRIYPTKIKTYSGTGVFKYVGDCCLPSATTSEITSIPVT